MMTAPRKEKVRQHVIAAKAATDSTMAKRLFARQHERVPKAVFPQAKQKAKPKVSDKELFDPKLVAQAWERALAENPKLRALFLTKQGAAPVVEPESPLALPPTEGAPVSRKPSRSWIGKAVFVSALIAKQLIAPLELGAQQITPEMVGAWIKEKRDLRQNRSWWNAPYLNDQQFGIGTSKPTSYALGTWGRGGITEIIRMKEQLMDLGIESFTENLKIVLLNKLEDGTHTYLIADAGMKGALVISLRSDWHEFPNNSHKFPFKLSDAFYIVESTGKGAVIVDPKNNKVIFVPADENKKAEGYDVPINNQKNDAVVVDANRSAILYGNVLQVRDTRSNNTTTLDLTPTVNSLYARKSPDVMAVVPVQDRPGFYYLFVIGAGWPSCMVLAVTPDNDIKIGGSIPMQGVTVDMK